VLPRARRFPLLPAAPDWLRDVPLAHRGLHGDGVPENSLAAFEAAARAGVGVELDVHRTRDGVPVVLHDPDLRRVTGTAGRVAALDLADVAAVRLRGTDLGVPTLADALTVLADVPVMVEVKNLGSRTNALEPAVAALLAQHPGPVCVASFNPRSLTWFRRNAAHLTRVQTAGPLLRVPMPAPLRWSLRTLRWLRAVQPAAVSYELAGIDHSAVQAYRAAGGTVVTWTVASPGDLDRARRFADNVVFERLPVDEVRPVA
jgi:glycerophosphoryl diester phosphodiesterase